mmetsp:Transcript_4904/g.11437  ORF Transcript_4904/g.11437 Transcript_4904/m.11437 type:complete len:217 (-) Transcript_4904:461-1111(-)
MEVWLFIIGYLINFAASCLLLYKIWRHKSIYGLSGDTQYCFLFATLARCFWSFDTRLVETWLAHFELLCSTVVACLLSYSVWRYWHTTTKQAPPYLRLLFAVPLAALLAFFFHPGRQWFTIQSLVAFTMYVEAVALLPQLFLMRNMIEIEPLTSHYVGLLVISRAVRIAFWIQLYIQGEHFVSLILADVLHSLFSADYFIMWIRKLRNGGALVYRL